MSRFRCESVIVFLLVVFVGVGFAGAKDADGNGVSMLRRTGSAFARVAKTAIPAVVSVKVESSVAAGQYPHPGSEDLFEYFFGPRYRNRVPQDRKERKQIGQGSGFIISKDGYILSNNHLVGEADKITVTLSDGREIAAELIGADKDSDVAVIKIAEKGLPVIELGDSDALEIGEWAIAVGNPFGLEASVTVGVVSAKGRRNLGITGVGGYEDFIQTDAAINPGNSGGPLLNIDGKAIGLNTAIFSQSGGYMGIGFAIPINMARNIKDQLVKFGKVSRGYIGITMDRNPITQELAKLFGLKKNKGVIVTEVLEGSPAEKGGVKKDDVVIRLNGKEVEDFSSFRNSIALLAPGTKIKITTWRDGKEYDLLIEVGLRDDEALSGIITSKTAREFGLQVKDIDADSAKKYGIEVGDGVFVSEVVKGSSAERKGVRVDLLILSVNRRYVSSVAEFNKEFEKLGEDKTVWLKVRVDGGYPQYVLLTRE